MLIGGDRKDRSGRGSMAGIKTAMGVTGRNTPFSSRTSEYLGA